MNQVMSARTSLADAIQRMKQSVKPFKPPPFPRLRFFWTGPTKVGKTSIVAGMPNSLLIDLEGGAHSLVQPRSAIIWCPVYHDRDLVPEHFKIAAERDCPVGSLTGIMEQLTAQSKLPDNPIQHVIFDSLDWLQEMCIRQLNLEYKQDFGPHVMDIREYKAGSNGSGGYRIVFERVLSFHRALTTAGYGWSHVGHITEKEKTVGKETRTIVRAAAFPGIYGPLCQECDYQIHLDMSSEFSPVHKKKVRVQTAYTQTFDSDSPLELGGRVSLPEKIQITDPVHGIDVVAEEYRKAVELKARQVAELQKECA